MSSKKEKNLNYYLNLKWSYTIEQEGKKGKLLTELQEKGIIMWPRSQK